MAAKFEVYKDVKGEFRWRLVSSNGQSIATAGQGYISKESAKDGIKAVQKDAPTAEIVDK